MAKPNFRKEIVVERLEDLDAETLQFAQRVVTPDGQVLKDRDGPISGRMPKVVR